MTHPLTGIDKEFQTAAPWSLVRAANAGAQPGKPVFIDKADICKADGPFTRCALQSVERLHWSFVPPARLARSSMATV